MTNEKSFEIGSIKFTALRQQFPRPHWLFRLDETGEVFGPGTGGISNESVPKMQASIQELLDLISKGDTNDFRKRFGLPVVATTTDDTKPRNAVHLLADDVDYRDADIYVAAGGEADWLITVTLNKADGSISEGVPRYSANNAECFEEHPEMVMPPEVRAEFDRLKMQAIAKLHEAEQEPKATASPEATAEVLPGAVRQEIASVQMSDIVGDYDTPDEVPEWAWVEKESSFSHRENGQSGVWEFVLNLSRHFESIPAKLIPVIQNAREANFAYLIFHQGT